MIDRISMLLRGKVHAGHDLLKSGFERQIGLKLLNSEKRGCLFHSTLKSSAIDNWERVKLAQRQSARLKTDLIERLEGMKNTNERAGTRYKKTRAL